MNGCTKEDLRSLPAFAILIDAGNVSTEYWPLMIHVWSYNSDLNLVKRVLKVHNELNRLRCIVGSIGQCDPQVIAIIRVAGASLFIVETIKGRRLEGSQSKVSCKSWSVSGNQLNCHDCRKLWWLILL